MSSNNGLMPDVKIDKNELLEVVKANLEKHKSDVEEALLLRRSQISRKLKDIVDVIIEKPDYQPEASLFFPIPTSNISEYEKAIRMIEMTQDEVIELSESQFDRLVLDNWSWKSELRSTSAMYGKSI